MDTSLEWKIVVGQKIFTSGHHMVAEKRKTATIMEVPSDGLRRNMAEDMAEDRHLWHLGMDRWLSANNNQNYCCYYYYYYYRIYWSNNYNNRAY